MELTVSRTPIMFQSHTDINSTNRVYNSLLMLFSMFPNNIFSENVINIKGLLQIVKCRISCLVKL